MDGKRGEGWPRSEARPRESLPRIENLKAAEYGYDREQVRDAFDAFYRHIAQLDSTLRALEAVEVFRDQAGELRKELRALKAAGWAQQPWPTHAPARVSPGLPESLPRFALEAAFLVLVAVVVAVSGFDRLSIVLVMALAWALVGVVEWVASRERFARARVAAPPRTREEDEPPAPLQIVPAQARVLARSESWEAPAAPQPREQEEEEEELTVVGIAEAEPSDAVQERIGIAVEPPAEEGHAVAADPEQEPEVAPEPAPEPVAAETADEQSGRWSWATDATVERAKERESGGGEPSPRRRWWRRSRDDTGFQIDAEQPRHVRVLPPEPSFDEQFPVEPAGQRRDPWEEDLDISIEEPEGGVAAERKREPAYADGDRDA